jgi:hypothetical protein
LTNPRGEITGQFLSSEPVTVELDVDLAAVPETLCIGFDLTTSDGVVVFRTYQTDAALEDWPRLALGRNRLACEIPPAMLNEGRYVVQPRIGLHCQRWIVNDDAGLKFDVQGDHAVSPYGWLTRPGVVAPFVAWRSSELSLSQGGDGTP